MTAPCCPLPICPVLHVLQPGGFSLATAPPAAAEALQQRLLPLVCGDIDLVASLQPEVGLRPLPAHVTTASAHVTVCLHTCMPGQLPTVQLCLLPCLPCPQGGELAYLSDCAASCAAVGLCLPLAQLEAICRYLQLHPQHLDGDVRVNLQRAFEAWDHQPGLALLAELAVAAV